MFVGIIIYLFKKNLPTIKEKLAEKLAFLKDLQKQRKNLIDQNKIVEQEIKEQEDLFRLLQEKIKVWNKSNIEESKKKEKELEKIKFAHVKRLETQSENIQQRKLLQEVFPRVISETYQHLEEKFSKPEESKKFLKGIIKSMEENI